MSEVDIYKGIVEKCHVVPDIAEYEVGDSELAQYTISKLHNEIANLKEQLIQYENPDDMTLFYMWLDEKAKDKMKQLQQENHLITEKLINAVNELEDYKTRCKKGIVLFQDEKSLTLNYNDLKHLRGILKGNEFDLRILQDKLNELRGK